MNALSLAPSPAITTADAATVSKYLAASSAPNTQRMYASAWAEFTAWCSAKGYDSLPAAAPTVAAYVAALADAQAKPATIQLKLSAVSRAHKLHAETLPEDQRRLFANPVTSPIVSSAMKGIRRTLRTAKTQKDAISPAELKKMLAAMGDDVQGKRDRAMILLGFAGAFRRSEIVGLDVTDIKLGPDEVTVTLRMSKTDQEGQGYTKTISCSDTRLLCPVTAIREWLKLVKTGPLFQGISKRGLPTGERLTPQVVALRIKHYAAAIGLDPARLAGHSLRSGFITSAYQAGVSEGDIAAVSGHANMGVMRGYNRSKAANQTRAVKAVLR